MLQLARTGWALRRRDCDFDILVVEDDSDVVVGIGTGTGVLGGEL